MAIRLLTLDLDHTLWDPDAALQRGEQASHAWLAQQVPGFASQCPPEALVARRLALREQVPTLRHRVSEIRRVAVRELLTDLGLPAAQAAALAEEAFQVFWRERQRVAVFPATEPLLQALAARYMLGALSNGNACLQAIGLHPFFAFHLAGEDFPAAKPAPDMFLAALQRAGVAASEAVHIGDHPVDDIAGASEAGLASIWVNLTGQSWPLAHCAPSREVHSLEAIPAALASLGD